MNLIDIELICVVIIIFILQIYAIITVYYKLHSKLWVLTSCPNCTTGTIRIKSWKEPIFICDKCGSKFKIKMWEEVLEDDDR